MRCFRLNTIAELDKTGSLLSECISKSEDDLENDMVMENQKMREWKMHRPSAEFSVLPSKQQRRTSGLHKVAELNTSDRIVATTTVVVPKEGTITASSTIETVPGNDDANAHTPQRHSRKRRKSSGEHKSRSHIDKNEPPIDTAVRFIGRFTCAHINVYTRYIYIYVAIMKVVKVKNLKKMNLSHILCHPFKNIE